MIRQLSVFLPGVPVSKDIAAQLDAIAAAEGVTLSRLIRRVLTAYAVGTIAAREPELDLGPPPPGTVVRPPGPPS